MESTASSEEPVLPTFEAPNAAPATGPRKLALQAGKKASKSVRQINQWYHEALRPKLQKARENLKQWHGQVSEQTGETVRRLSAHGQEQARSVGEATRSLSFATQAKVAVAAAAAQQSLQEIGQSPLITTTTPDGQVVHDIKGQETDPYVTLFPWEGMGAVAAFSFLSALISLILVVSHVVDVASFVLLGVAPLVLVQKTKLMKLGTFRQQVNTMRQSINTMRQENDQLHNSVQQLSTHVESLKHVESDLNDLAQQSGAQVDRLVNIVHQNGELQAQIKKQLQAQVMQQIMTAIMSSDHNHDMTVGGQEAEVLILRLSNIPGVEFDADRFRQVVAADVGVLTLQDVLGIARSFNDHVTKSEGEAIFHFHPRAILQSPAANGAPSNATNPGAPPTL